MKKFEKIDESKFEKFQENELSNAHMIFGGKFWVTNPGGHEDGVNDSTDNGASWSSDGGHTWSSIDLYTDVAGNDDYLDAQVVPQSVLIREG